jgi:heme/copper-type cytochrome/quinol oxidase subunit 4
MTTTEGHGSERLGKYVVVYVCMLVIAALQFVIAYQAIDHSQMLVRMLVLAFLEAGLAVMFFMHLWAEKRALLMFVGIFTLFVLATMNYGWTDSFRLLVFRLSK